MARWRSYSPDLHGHRSVRALSDAAFRLFMCVLNHADDEGRHEHDPVGLCAHTWIMGAPGDPVALFKELEDVRLVRVYTVADEEYFEVPHFRRQADSPIYPWSQIIQHPTKSSIPPRPAGSTPPDPDPPKKLARKINKGSPPLAAGELKPCCLFGEESFERGLLKKYPGITDVDMMHRIITPFCEGVQGIKKCSGMKKCGTLVFKVCGAIDGREDPPDSYEAYARRCLSNLIEEQPEAFHTDRPHFEGEPEGVKTIVDRIMGSMDERAPEQSPST